MRRWAGRHEVALYLVLAFLISWSIWLLVLFNPDSSPLVPFGPGLAAVIVALVAGGRRELFDLLRQLGRWRVNPGWYGVALSLPLGVGAAALGAAMMAGAQAPQWEPSDLLQVVGSLLVTIVIVGLFEELGWRGFLLPRLQRERTALVAALLVGLVWLPWHLPELVSDRGGASAGSVRDLHPGELGALCLALQQHPGQPADRHLVSRLVQQLHEVLHLRSPGQPVCGCLVDARRPGGPASRGRRRVRGPSGTCEGSHQAGVSAT